MNTIFSSATKKPNWLAIILVSLGFWLSGSFVLDFILIPCLSFSGMMAGNDFPSASFLIFGVFNHLEIICASLILTVTLMFSGQGFLSETKQGFYVIFSIILLVIAFAFTYLFTPNMAGYGLLFNKYNLDATMPTAMMFWHGIYWFLEVTKLSVITTLLTWYCNE